MPQEALDKLAEFSEQALKAQSSEELLGIEGSAARIYFLHFGEMLKPETGVSAFDFIELCVVYGSLIL
jgi:CRISPR-associated protein Cas1